MEYRKSSDRANPCCDSVMRIGTTCRAMTSEQKLLCLLIDHGEYTQEQMAKEIGVSVRTIERNLSSLQRKGKVERIGSKKNGRWIVMS